MTPPADFTKAARALLAKEAQLATRSETIAEEKAAAAKERDGLCALAAGFAPFRSGDLVRIASADRVASARCAHVSGIILPGGNPGWNAVFVLEGSKSVICRIDHDNYGGHQDGLYVTTAVFSRDAVTAGYLRDLRASESPA